MIKSGTKIAKRYKVEKHIGAGGMQDVYQGYDELIGQEVAIKTPQAGQAERRFQASAIMAGRINHYNVAKTYDYFEFKDKVFLVEELVSGQTLEEAILGNSEFIDPDLASSLFQMLAKGLAASHHAGVIHRDLKPSNIIVSGGFNLDEVKITDFGIATFTEEIFDEAADEGDLTRSTSGTVRGALPYMAPEMMFRGPGDHPGKPADVWSLGALMFRVISGQFPFGLGFDVPANIKLRERKAWPNFLISNIQFSTLAKSLMEIIERCLSWDEKLRPSADQLVHELSDLCYCRSDRKLGTVIETRYGNVLGNIRDDEGDRIFYHSTSIFGPRRAQEKMRVSYASFPGVPYPRAHPILILK